MSEIEKLQRENEALKKALNEERQGRVRDQVTALIIERAGDRWTDPRHDIVPTLLAAHKREPKAGAAGEFVDVFVISSKDGKTKEAFDVGKALEVFEGREDFHYYLRRNGNRGTCSANPWAKDAWNVTEQHKLIAANPEKARQMAAMHGVTIP
jgi:hypothetical protein